MPETADEEGAGLGVERELPEVHLAAGLDGQPLGVGDPTVGGYPDEPGWANSRFRSLIILPQ